MTSRHRRVRLLFGAAALAASLTTSLAACSSTSSSSATTVAGTSTDGIGTGTATVTVPADPAAALAEGVAALDVGYHFTATVTVNGATQVVADGDRNGSNSRLAITSAGATVDYVITADGSWAKPADGEWQLLEVAPATSDPIDALRAPVAVEVSPSTGGTLHVKVTVTAVSLGIQAEGNVSVLVNLQGGVITLISYDATVQGGTANVSTAISAITDTTAITAPAV
ncbi:MAG: hypothetical protein F2681_10315 [Actinobacteria bacterium]|uniref:Unannotated protein n=1 Tax=freshwater metagenome TaxID=449393 RepID=A0A6J6A5K4_9ZZZZ|nr:hypothetical protein [Actinomycetota bacterium]MSW78277.1 hypothetical protein [Actinomycetota bacterium]MSX54610.1 hypothetical protein [Actinomycetota bacterium]MSX94289.1 hypothetical protein [Actinomycetota bacterium]MSZ83523.1 hypothetical protein [Actinomycetota bacterium]